MQGHLVLVDWHEIWNIYFLPFDKMTSGTSLPVFFSDSLCVDSPQSTAAHSLSPADFFVSQGDVGWPVSKVHGYAIIGKLILFHIKYDNENLKSIHFWWSNYIHNTKS